MGIDMKYIILLFFLLLLSGCYSANTPEHYIHFGTRAYGIQYGGEKYFEVEPKNGPTYFFNQILTGKFSKTSTNAQKAYAYMYLARIKLRRNLLNEAIPLLDKSEEYANLFPYKSELLAGYFYKNGKVTESKRYYEELIKWIDKRIAEVDSGKFDVDTLEFMSMRSYSDRGFESDYKDMYRHLEKPKDFRERVYIKYLSDKKQLALRRISEMDNGNKAQ